MAVSRRNDVSRQSGAVRKGQGKDTLSGTLDKRGKVIEERNQSCRSFRNNRLTISICSELMLCLKRCWSIVKKETRIGEVFNSILSVAIGRGKKVVNHIQDSNLWDSSRGTQNCLISIYQHTDKNVNAACKHPQPSRQVRNNYNNNWAYVL